MQNLRILGHQEGADVVPHDHADGGQHRHHPEVQDKTLFYKLLFSHHLKQLL